MTLPLGKQVCGVRWAKRLRAAGVKQRSHWYWFKQRVPRRDPHTGQVVERTVWGLGGRHDPDVDYEVVSAFTVAELGNHLAQLRPDHGYNSKGCYMPYRAYYPHTGRVEWKYDWPYSRYARDIKVMNVRTEANARAAFLLALIEHRQSVLNGAEEHEYEGVPTCLR